MTTKKQFGPKGWTPDQLGSLTGKTYLITGANAGAGFEATRVFLSKGARVVMMIHNGTVNSSAPGGNGTVPAVSLVAGQLSPTQRHPSRPGQPHAWTPTAPANEAPRVTVIGPIGRPFVREGSPTCRGVAALPSVEKITPTSHRVSGAVRSGGDRDEKHYQSCACRIPTSSVKLFTT